MLIFEIYTCSPQRSRDYENIEPNADGDISQIEIILLVDYLEKIRGQS
jgi:hypothetical protein